MSEEPKPNLKNGFALADLLDGAMAAGKVDDEEVLLVRRDDEISPWGHSVPTIMARSQTA